VGVLGGGASLWQRAVEAIGGSTDWDERIPDTCGEKGDFYSGLAARKQAAPGAGPGT
jgi:hypothetical protein